MERATRALELCSIARALDRVVSECRWHNAHQSWTERSARLRLRAAEPAVQFSGRHHAVVVHAISLAVAFLLLTNSARRTGRIGPEESQLQRAGPVAFAGSAALPVVPGHISTGDRSTRWNQPMDPERIGAISPPEPHARAFRRRIGRFRSSRRVNAACRRDEEKLILGAIRA